MATKKFSKYLHKVYDEPARKAVAAWANMKWGLDVRDNPDRYGVDLICFRSNLPVGYIEVEVRQEGFDSFHSIHAGLRKEKLFRQDRPVLFFALTQDLQRAYYLKADLIKDCPLIEVHNRYVGKGEMFYNIPISLFKIADLTQKF